MRILAIQGSPRDEGNTQTVLDVVLTAARSAGADIELVHVFSLRDLSGCMECFSCQRTSDGPGCPLDDDMQGLFVQALRADVIVWATPVFCWTVAWPLKMVMDRFYCMFKFEGADRYHCLLEGKKMAAVITAGGGEKDGADLVDETLRRMAHFSRSRSYASFIATHVRSPESILADHDLIERAKAFGRQLAG